MDCEYRHQSFNSVPRRSQTLRNDRCQNILYKAVFEHFKEIKTIATLLLSSKSFQNSSFGANFLVNYAVDFYSIDLLESALSPSSFFSLQFAPSLHITLSWRSTDTIKLRIFNFVAEIVKTKYLHLSLRSLTLEDATRFPVSFFFGSSSNTWPHLHDLILANCFVNDAVLEEISKNAVYLRTLNFRWTSGITDSGFSHISKLANVTSLDLWDCGKVADSSLEHVYQLPRITSLNLHFCKLITDAGLENISTLSNITSLKLRFCHNITDAGIEHISKLSSITAVTLSGDNIGDSCLQHISRLSGITSLDLFWTNITDAGLEHVSKLCGITFLNLEKCREITDAGLESISNLSGITSLNLARCHLITDAGLEHIAKISNITNLHLTFCGKITDVGLEHISSLSGIKSLDLTLCANITDIGLEHISKLSNITSLTLLRCNAITGAGLEHLSKLSRITSLDLTACFQVRDEATAKFNTALPNCTIQQNSPL